MKKAILISIKPECVAKILSGEKTVEIRKTVPKCELPIDVYIYCAKDGVVIEKNCDLGFPEPINGKVVAKFTLKKVGNVVADGAFGEDCGRRIYYLYRELDDPEDFDHWGIYRNAAISESELASYLRRKNGYAWHISDLEVFGEPKKLSDFRRLLDKGTYSKADYLSDAVWEGRGEVTIQQEKLMAEKLFSINRAPQSWQYIEVKK